METSKVAVERQERYDHKIVGYIKNKLMYNFLLPQQNLLLLQSAESELRNR